jgi:hypothetical protein
VAALLSFVLPRGESLTALHFLPHTTIGQHVSTEALVDTIRRVVQCRLEDQMRERCQHSNAVNFAVDGWTDLRGRRYQGVTAQLVRYDADCSAETAVLVLKEIKSIHQTGDELRAVLRLVQQRFGIGDKTISICTDRSPMNEWAFRGDLAGGFATGTICLPCVCHLLNNLLSQFVENISDVVTPTFRLLQRSPRRNFVITITFEISESLDALIRQITVKAQLPMIDHCYCLLVFKAQDQMRKSRSISWFPP